MMQPMGATLSSAPAPTNPADRLQIPTQAGGGLQTPGNLGPLLQALQQAKLRNVLAGKLPGTTPQSLGSGTGMSDAGSATAPPPLNLGGNPGPMVA